MIVCEFLNVGPGVPTAGFGSETCGPITAPASSAGAFTLVFTATGVPAGFVVEPGPDCLVDVDTLTTGSGAFLINPFDLTTYPPLCLGVSLDFFILGLGGATTGV